MTNKMKSWSFLKPSKTSLTFTTGPSKTSSLAKGASKALYLLLLPTGKALKSSWWALEPFAIEANLSWAVFQNLDKVEYKGTELIRKWQKDYTEEKIKEKEESVKQKLQRKKKAQEVKAAAEEAKAENKKDDFELPKGASLFITGMTNETTREDIKEVLKEKMNVEEPDYAYVYFNKGDTEGQVRFKKENFAKELIAKIPEEGLTIKDQKVEIKLLEGDEEKEFLSSCIASLQKRFGKKGHKRKGDSRGGRGGKRHRSNWSEISPEALRVSVEKHTYSILCKML